jgi:2'-5' RNA ligase
MRLFVAMDLNDSVRNAISQFCERLRPLCPSARWVRVEGMHVTLKFLGESNESLLAKIPEALAGVRSTGPVEMNYRGTGFFPSPERPRVLWIGIAASPNLAEIAAEIESRLEPLGISREKRDFKPHLTLARFESPHGLDALRRELEFEGLMEFGSVHSGEFYLYQSHSQHGGSRYTRLRSFRFATEAAA